MPGTGPPTKLRAGPRHLACLVDGPGMALCTGPGWPRPVEYRVMPCSCRAKIAGFVPCERATGCILIFSRSKGGQESACEQVGGRVLSGSKTYL
jgi:hypothetical protein